MATKMWDNYLKSSRWTDRRAEAFKRDMGVCRHCNTAKATEVHHTHRPVDPANDHLDFVLSVCGPCHRVQMNDAHASARTPMLKLLMSALKRHDAADMPFWYVESLRGWYIAPSHARQLLGDEVFAGNEHLMQMFSNALEQALKTDVINAHNAPRVGESLPVLAAIEVERRRLFSWPSIVRAIDLLHAYLSANSQGVADLMRLMRLARVRRDTDAMLNDGLTRLLGITEATTPAGLLTGKLDAALQVMQRAHKAMLASSDLIPVREFMAMLNIADPSITRAGAWVAGLSASSKERLDARLGKQAALMFGKAKAQREVRINAAIRPVAARTYKEWNAALEAVVERDGLVEEGL